MEEDIKILEEFINNYKSVQEKYKDDEIQSEIERSCYFEEVPAQAIENLLKRYKELEEENKQDKKLIYGLNKDNLDWENKFCDLIRELDSSIHTSVIEEKKKEVREEFNKVNTAENNEWYIDSEKYSYAEDKLQEILEEGRK